ncbi:hypothetical protein vseg_005171 [Gypsophila vaccaria]
MARCFSLTATLDTYYRYSFETSGLKSTTLDIDNDTKMHCWGPKKPDNTKPNLTLLHGLGANAMWQWDYFIANLAPKFNVYVPDLVFFGESYTTGPQRDEAFQARSVMSMLQKLNVHKTNVAGISYGGFVAYSMAAQFSEAVHKVIIVCAGVCLEEKDMSDGLFRVSNVEDAAEILLPLSRTKMRELLKISFYKPRRLIPSCFLDDYIQVMCTEHREERKQLIAALHKDRNLTNLPKITQTTLIVWGEHDQVFPIELAHRLKRHLGDSAQLVIVKKAGHAINIEKPKQLYKNMKSFLLNKPLPTTASHSNDSRTK